ncbi:MAG: hypothetical protein Q8N44_18320 [Rubrivivax sp.]|nr:hypothetical protein [Rubrivivax sp.]
MNSRRSRPLALIWAGSLLSAGLAFSSALAADKPDPAAAAAAARYEQERALCTSGRSNQDRATCLREAGAALAEARKHQLDGDAAQYAINERKRCQRLPDDDRKACLARMQGQGTTSGSVASGGIYRELVTREVVAPSAAAPASAPKAAAQR